MGGGCPWSPQQITWTPRPSSQSRKVSRVGPGTVQTSSQTIRRGMNFCPILSGVHSIGRSCGRSGPGRPWSASFWPGDWSGRRRGDLSGGRARSLTWFCRCPHRCLGSSSGASAAGRRGAARSWKRGPICVCFANYIIRLGEIGCMFHGHVELLVLITPFGWGDRGKVLLPEQTGNAHPAVAFFHGYESLNPFKPP